MMIDCGYESKLQQAYTESPTGFPNVYLVRAVLRVTLDSGPYSLLNDAKAEWCWGDGAKRATFFPHLAGHLEGERNRALSCPR